MARHLAGLALMLPIAAQSSWADLQPPGGVLASGVSVSDHLVLYRNGNYLRVFSAITGRWHAHTPSFGTTPVLTKDLLLVPESDRWTAFSAFTGAFAVLPIVLANTSILHNDSVACVIDGANVHTFSAFTGQWVTRTIPSGWQVQIGARVALLTSPWPAPAGASAFDCYSGSWVDLPPQSPPAFGGTVTGDVAMTSSPTTLFGFSAQRGGWTSAPITLSFPFPYSQPVYFERLLAGMSGTLYSGLTGTFLPSPTPTGTMLVSQRVAAMGDGATVRACSASHMQWSEVAAPLVQAGEGIAIAFGAGQMHAFQPSTGAVASTPYVSGYPSNYGSTRNLVVIHDATTGGHPVYSAYTGQWHTPPADTLSEAAWATGDAALFRTAGGGLVAFSARTGAFVPLPGTGLTRHSGFAASDATTYYVFDADADRWLSRPRTPGAGFGPVFFGHTMLATDASQALGFSTRGHRFDAVVLPQPVADVQARNLVGFVRTADHLLAFSGLPDTATWQDAPAGLFGVAIGTTARAQVRTPASSVVLVAFGPEGTGPVALPPYGELWIDPSAALLLLPTPSPGGARATFPIAVPNSASLRGTRWFEQALTLESGGTIRLDPPSTLLVQ